MSHVSDFTKGPEEIILDLINDSNRITLTEDDIRMGTVSAAPEGSARNTNLSVQAKEGSGYGGSVVVNYDRLPVEEFLVGNSLTYDVEENLTISDFITKINEWANINLVEGIDYDNAPIGNWNSIPQEVKLITVTIKPTSLVYHGSILLTINANLVSLAGVVTVKELGTWDDAPEEPSRDIASIFDSTDLPDFS